MVVDLSRDAIAARDAAERATGSRGGMTGAELIRSAATGLQKADRLMRAAHRIGVWKHAGRTRRDQARQLTINAAAQLEVAGLIPPERRYLHELSQRQIENCRAIVLARLGDQDDEQAWALFAVDTHRRALDARSRTTTQEH